MTNGRVSTVDALRGIASFTVCWYHLTDRFPRGEFLQRSGAIGWFAVEIFFVISGFVVPWALNRVDYRLSDFGRFVWKRIVRLDPPYLASILFVVAMALFVTMRNGAPFTVTIPQLLAHLAYANVIVDLPWLNPVYWTLAVEFQYYLLIGLAYPWLKRANPWSLGATALIVLVAGLALPHPRYVVRHLPLFFMGLIVFHVRTGKLAAWKGVALLVAFTVPAISVVGFFQAPVGLATALLILFANITWRPLLYLGTISYSLYLLHYPVSSLSFGIMGKLLPAGEGWRVASLFIAIAACVVASHLFHRLVEHPAQRWSQRIGRSTRAPEATSGIASEH